LPAPSTNGRMTCRQYLDCRSRCCRSNARSPVHRPLEVVDVQQLARPCVNCASNAFSSGRVVFWHCRPPIGFGWFTPLVAPTQASCGQDAENGALSSHRKGDWFDRTEQPVNNPIPSKPAVQNERLGSTPVLLAGRKLQNVSSLRRRRPLRSNRPRRYLAMSRR
jgi:hypothetical protein